MTSSQAKSKAGQQLADRLMAKTSLGKREHGAVFIMHDSVRMKAKQPPPQPNSWLSQATGVGGGVGVSFNISRMVWLTFCSASDPDKLWLEVKSFKRQACLSISAGRWPCEHLRQMHRSFAIYGRVQLGANQALRLRG